MPLPAFLADEGSLRTSPHARLIQRLPALPNEIGSLPESNVRQVVQLSTTRDR